MASIDIIRDTVESKGLFYLLRMAVRYSVIDFILTPLMIVQAKKLNPDLSIQAIVDYSFKAFDRMIFPLQVKSEITSFLIMLKDRKVKTILEIGSARGGMIFLFSRIVSDDAKIISIDLPGFIIGRGYPPWRHLLYSSFAMRRQKIILIRGDSHADSTLMKVKSSLRNDKLDLLFIDGDHSYDGVKRDFEKYKNMVRKNGIIAFHDIAPKCSLKDCGVPRFWNEVKKNYKHKELIENPKQDAAGIGILFI